MCADGREIGQGMTIQYPRRRNRLRYPGYDYAQPGAVFVTICTYGHRPLFGMVDQGRMAYSPAGEMVLASWQRIPGKHREIVLDAFVVMPDHVHGVLFVGSGSEEGREPPTVGDAVRWFKSATVRAYRDGVMTHGWDAYDRHLWQDKFHDRIIRSDTELDRVRAYIMGNPARWWERQEAERSEPWPRPMAPPT